MRQVLSEREMCGNCEMIWQVNLFPCELLRLQKPHAENVVGLIGHKDPGKFFLFVGWAVHLGLRMGREHLGSIAQH